MKNKPNLCKILGVDVNELFELGDMGNFWIDPYGKAKSELFDENSSAKKILLAVNNPDMIHHKCNSTEQCKFTEQDLTICKAIGAKYISRNDDTDDEFRDFNSSYFVDLWEENPVMLEDGAFLGDGFIMRLQIVDNGKFFSNIQPGECYCIESIKTNSNSKKICSNCIHEYACAAWNTGDIHDTDATSCANYEEIRDSVSYFIGYREGESANNNEK